MSETREEALLRTSEVYRRLRADALPERSAAAIDLSRDATPPDTARAVAQAIAPKEAELPPPGPGFVRRMLTRRPDTREIALLVVVAAALVLSRG